MTETTSTKTKIIPFQDATETAQNLARVSKLARDYAYSPYSNFPVGAALLSQDDTTIFQGCNVENSSYGVTVCAEQTAICKAVSSGVKKFKAIAVCAESTDITTPCGKCRQFIFEFGSDIEIYAVRPDLKEILITSASELLPYGFHF